MARPKVQEILSPEARTRRQFGRAGIDVIGGRPTLNGKPLPASARRFLKKERSKRITRQRIQQLKSGAKAFTRGAVMFGEEAIKQEQILEKEFLSTPKKRGRSR